MKNLLLSILCLCSIAQVSATHIIGGSLTYEYLGSDQYKIKLEVLVDCYNGIPDFDNPAHLGIYDNNNNIFDTIDLFYSDVDTISSDIPNNVCIYPSNVCVRRAIYDTIITLPNIAVGYTIAYQRCCRTTLLQNISMPDTLGMTFHTFVNTSLQNSSPQFNSEVPVAVFVKTPFVFDASASDADGDSLVYELIAPFDGGGPLISMLQPNPPLPPPYNTIEFLSPYSINDMIGGNDPVTINSVTGEINGIPNTIGFFQIAYGIKEYRNGLLINTVYREFGLLVLDVIVGQNYDISGRIFMNNNIPLDIGSVQIFERELSTDSLYLFAEQNIGPNGTYAIEGIPAGVFYLKALIDSNSQYYNDYIPTYYSSSAFWSNAQTINQCDTSQFYRDINLIHVDALNGMLVLNGSVLRSSGNSDPIENLTLLIGDENGTLRQARSINENGLFRFNNLTPGAYLLYADLINSTLNNSNPVDFELTENTTVQVLLFEDSLSIDINTSTIESINDDLWEVKIFPNPVNEKLQLSLYAKENIPITAKIYTINGHFVDVLIENTRIQSGEIIFEYDSKHLTNGTYFIELDSNNSYSIVKFFIKN